MQPDESEEEEGLEWDELERRAIESDRKQIEMARMKAREGGNTMKTGKGGSGYTGGVKVQ